MTSASFAFLPAAYTLFARPPHPWRQLAIGGAEVDRKEPQWTAFDPGWSTDGLLRTPERLTCHPGFWSDSAQVDRNGPQCPPEHSVGAPAASRSGMSRNEEKMNRNEERMSRFGQLNCSSRTLDPEVEPGWVSRNEQPFPPELPLRGQRTPRTRCRCVCRCGADTLSPFVVSLSNHEVERQLV